jgi:hypothetical protein
MNSETYLAKRASTPVMERITCKRRGRISKNAHEKGKDETYTVEQVVVASPSEEHHRPRRVESAKDPRVLSNGDSARHSVEDEPDREDGRKGDADAVCSESLDEEEEDEEAAGDTDDGGGDVGEGDGDTGYGGGDRDGGCEVPGVSRSRRWMRWGDMERKRNARVSIPSAMVRATPRRTRTKRENLTAGRWRNLVAARELGGEVASA